MTPFPQVEMKNGSNRAWLTIPNKKWGEIFSDPIVFLRYPNNSISQGKLVFLCTIKVVIK